jgi:hypothetical protein
MNRRNFLKVVAASVGAQPALCNTGAHSRHSIEFTPDRIVVAPLRSPDAEGFSLQEAIDQASARGCQIVELLAGSYRTSGLTITGPLWLKGASGQSIIEFVGGRASFLNVHPPSGVPRISGIRLSELVFRGEGLASSDATDSEMQPISAPPINHQRITAILAARCIDELTVTNCRFERACDAAIALWRCEGAQVTNNFVGASRISFYSHAGRGNVFSANDVGADMTLGAYVAHHC